MMLSEGAAMMASFNRAEFLRLTALSTGWLLTGGLGRAIGEPRTSQPIAADDDLEARIARVIAEYDRQGIHRTARASTPGRHHARRALSIPVSHVHLWIERELPHPVPGVSDRAGDDRFVLTHRAARCVRARRHVGHDC